jgi:pimeloyl-ACP methyl ester carboxylesterase
MERIVLGLIWSHGFEAAMWPTQVRLDRMIKISKITSRARLSGGGGSCAWSQRNMPLTTTEVPTFFGPSDSPLFGVLHLPVDNQIRGGVLICGSLGKEGMDSVRLRRILGENLARRGFGVLHFDYLGLGDSACAQGRDDAVANWVASVGHALDYLTLIGAESVTAIGIRAGCLILNEYLAQSHTVNRVVYLDPYGTGRRYLREHTTLFRLSAGEDAATPGEVSIIGGRLSDRAAAEFAALRMGANPVSAHGVDNVLLVGRPAETDKRVTALASAEGVDSIITRGLPECAAPTVTPMPIPFTAVDSIIDWIDGNVPTRTHRGVPQYLTTVTMPAEGPDGVDVFESIERIEPNGLFAIRTLPRRRRPASAKTVLFFMTSNDLHVGPTRQWVELSRRIAAAGSQALRWDPAGQGLSGQISRDPFRFMFSKADITDSIAVARHACQDAGELELVGTCNGAWYAAQAARNTGARSAILVNVQDWNWRVTPTLLSQRSLRKKALHANAASDTGGGAGESRTERLKALLKPAHEQTKSFMHNHLPRYVLRVLSWVGLVWLPEDVLTTLAHRGTGVTVIASPEDEERFTARGGRAALDRLQRTSQPPRLIATPTGDHSANHPAILAAIRNAVLPVAATPSGSERAHRQRRGGA